jgi:hypothetical protein
MAMFVGADVGIAVKADVAAACGIAVLPRLAFKHRALSLDSN